MEKNTVKNGSNETKGHWTTEGTPGYIKRPQLTHRNTYLEERELVSQREAINSLGFLILGRSSVLNLAMSSFVVLVRKVYQIGQL